MFLVIIPIKTANFVSIVRFAESKERKKNNSIEDWKTFNCLQWTAEKNISFSKYGVPVNNLSIMKCFCYFFSSCLHKFLGGKHECYTPRQGTNKEKYFHHWNNKVKMPNLAWKNTFPPISSLISFPSIDRKWTKLIRWNMISKCNFPCRKIFRNSFMYLPYGKYKWSLNNCYGKKIIIKKEIKIIHGIACIIHQSLVHLYFSSELKRKW